MLPLLLTMLAIGLIATWPGSAQLPNPVDVGLDPGHSSADIGASGGGLREYEVTLDLAQRVRGLLEQQGFTVRLSRADSDPVSAMDHPDPIERVRIEQQTRIEAVGRARVFVSIHFNGGPPELRGTETYYNPDNFGPDSSRLAEALQRQVRVGLLEAGYKSPDRGVKADLLAGKPYGHFFSLRGPLPSVLVEALFLSNPTEAALLQHDDVRQALALGYSRGIAEFLAVGALGPGARSDGAPNSR